MLLDKPKQLSVNVDAVEQQDVETALNVCITSFGVCSLLIQSDKNMGGSGR